MDASLPVASVAIGVGATLTMDAWNLLLKRGFGIPSLDFCMLGRWVGHLAEGRVRHERIGASAPKPHECAIGWAAHYSIGIALAFAFLSLIPAAWRAEPTALPAVAYGLVTVAFPLFVLQPSLGLGVASSRTPHPARARVKSLATHLVFGVGLYLWALVLR